MYDPWADLKSRPGIVFNMASLPTGDAWWLPGIQAIAVNRGLSRIERRCALAHELAHVDLGDVHMDGRAGRRNEDEADQLAARRLITIEELAAVIFADDYQTAADALDVSEHILRVRMKHLHPAERGALKRARSMREETA
ncbi:MAG TPA: ImmA/IrrE family metallo-endopeptidase [Acidothermaceae bacterium]